MTTRSIAVAQTCPVSGDVHANLEEHVRLARHAAARGAGLVVFPELSLTGYEIGLAARLAFVENDPRLEPLIDVAASLNLIVIAGAPVRLDGTLHVAAFVIAPDRGVSLYTKQRLGAFSDAARCDGILPPAEATVFAPGDRDPLVALDRHHAAALAICADVGQPAHPARAVARGARTYLASMFVIRSAFDDEAAKLKGYASQHGMVVALANFGSPSGGLAAAGCSSIWSDRGDLLVQLGPDGAGVAVATEMDDGWKVMSTMLDEGQPVLMV